MSARPWGLDSLPAPLLPLDRTFEGFLGLEWHELSDDSFRVSFKGRDNLK